MLAELLAEPLARVSELSEAANRRSDQDDLTEANVQAALEQISCEPVRHVLQEQLSKGKAHYQEEYLLKEMTRTFSSQAGEQAGIVAEKDSANRRQADSQTAVRETQGFDRNIGDTGVDQLQRENITEAPAGHWKQEVP